MDANSASMEEAIKRAEGMTAEKFWAFLMEIGAKIEESRVKSEKEFEELRKSHKETAEQMKETDKQIKKLSKNIGGISNSLGSLTEGLFSAKLWKRLNAYGYIFTRQNPHAKFIEDDIIIAEADSFLENGDYVMPVEVKTELSADDVNEHLERIEIIRGYMDKHNDARKIVGAVAGGTVQENVLKYAQRKGLYVFVQSGDAVEIAVPPKGFKAREW